MAGKKITINNRGQFAGNVDSPSGRVHVDRQEQTPFEAVLHNAPANQPHNDGDPRAARMGAGTNVQVWLDGTFFVLAFLVVVAALAFVASTVPGWAIPIVLIAAVIGYTLIGAIVLRLRGERGLSEKGTLALMKEALLLTPLLRLTARKQPKGTGKDVSAD